MKVRFVTDFDMGVSLEIHELAVSWQDLWGLPCHSGWMLTDNSWITESKISENSYFIGKMVGKPLGVCIYTPEN